MNKTKILELKQTYISENKTISSLQSKTLSIVILNAPCNGFGDIIFAMKLAHYIKKWYNVSPKIASTQIKSFIDLGHDEKDMIHLTTDFRDGQCRRFIRLSFPLDLPVFDVILVAPVSQDFKPSISDVRSKLPYANRMNTLFFSEYNDVLDKEFDFNTGLGKGYDGLFIESFVDLPKKLSINGLLPNRYAVSYIAQRDDACNCLHSFVKLIVKKYSATHNSFDIVIPNWVEFDSEKSDFYTTGTFAIVRTCLKYFDEVYLQTKTYLVLLRQNAKIEGRPRSKLTFRQDIMPLPYPKMAELYKFSVREILITGDQSISDVIGCCWQEKLPFYQIVPWKKAFAKQLARLLPQKYIRSKKTSCGSISATKYKPQFKRFVEKNNFAVIGKPKLDALLRLIYDYKE
jgi:hypothetical protein